MRTNVIANGMYKASREIERGRKIEGQKMFGGGDGGF